MDLPQAYLRAKQCLEQGKKAEAREFLRTIVQNAPDGEFRYVAIQQYANAAKSLPDEESIKFFSIGLNYAQTSNKPDGVAFFSLHLAQSFAFQLSLLVGTKKKLSGIPGWMNFSTEADKARGEQLSKTETQLRGLLAKMKATGQRAMPQVANQRDLALCEHFMAQIFCSEAQLQQVAGLRLTSLDRMCVELNLPAPFRFPITVRWQIARSKRLCAAHLRRMATLAKKVGDDSLYALAIYNLAVCHNTFGHYWRAALACRKAELLASKFKESSLLKRSQMLRRAIAARGKDVPDYWSGESRPEWEDV